MVNDPVKFTRMAAAFHQASREKASPCNSESSGSEHSAASPFDHLSHLVNSFLHRDIGWEETSGREFEEDDEADGDGDHQLDQPTNSEFQSSLEKLFDCGQNSSISDNIRKEVEAAVAEQLPGEPNFKRRLMAVLRSRGFDAGLCKSKWEKNGRRPSGDHEYIDVNADGSRYIVEVFLADEFSIARAPEWYSSLLEAFPVIMVSTPEKLQKLVRLMSKAMRKSMKSMKLKLPPWRGLAYLLIKWFGPYKRTTNEAPIGKTTALIRTAAEVPGSNRMVGFAPATESKRPVKCRDEAYRGGGKIGNLRMMLGGGLEFKCISNADQIRS